MFGPLFGAVAQLNAAIEQARHDMERRKIWNLHVEREKRRRENDESELIWTCLCGSRTFYWYRTKGLRCTKCDAPNIPTR